MTPYERLNRVRDSYDSAQRLLQKIEELENLATHMTPTLSESPSSRGSNTREDTWAKLIDYKMQCEEKIADYIRGCVELEEELTCIKSSRIRTAMQYYYVDRVKQEKIAEKMHYSERQIRSLLQKGRRIYMETYK